MNKKCYFAAIRLLAKKDYSQYKLSKKLKEKNYPSEIIKEVIDELVEKKYLQEEEYVRSRMKFLMRKGYSKEFIKLTLQKEHLRFTTIFFEDILQEFNYQDENQIKGLLEKKILQRKLGELPEKERNKIFNFIQRRGFSYEKIKSCAYEYM